MRDRQPTPCDAENSSFLILHSPLPTLHPVLCDHITEWKSHLIHRRDTLRADRVSGKALENAENVQFYWNSTIEALHSEASLTGITVKDAVTGERRYLPLDGLFISVGRDPATWLFRGQLELDAGGYIVADESTRTSLPGVFAVGDVRTKAVRQIVTADDDGAVAAHFAEAYLNWR